jgi:small subunit ribosomal protein S5
MSVARSSECLLCSFSKASRAGTSARRQFHSSSVHQNRKPRFPNVKHEERKHPTHPLAYLKDRANKFFSEDESAPKKYSSQQRAAIEAAKKFGTLQHIKDSPGRMRAEPWTMDYFDDLTTIDPVIDKPVRAPWTNLDDAQRMKDDDEIADDFIELAMKETSLEKWVDEDGVEHLVPGAGENEWMEFDKNLRLTLGREEAELSPRSALAPDLPNISEQKKTKQDVTKTRGNQDGQGTAGPASREAPSPALVALMQMTGYSSKQISQLRVKTIIVHRVTNQTRLGKIHRVYMLSVAGNGNGMIGIGEGKSSEGMDARLQSQYRAIRNMQPILRYEDRTVFGDLKAKFSATELELYPRPPGMF